MEKPVFQCGARVGSFVIEAIEIGALEGLQCYRAIHRVHQTPALIHVCDLRKSPLKSDGVQAFKHKVEQLQQLRVHALPALIDAGIDSGVQWTAFPLPEGSPLHEYVANHGALHPAEGAVLLGELARTLHAARGAGPHGILEARSIYIGLDGKLRDVLHFGMARLFEIAREPSLYQPPEQRMHRGFEDERADIFAAAAIVWEAIAGDEPGATSQPDPLRHERLARRIPNLKSVRPEVPNALADLLFRWTSHDAHERPRDWVEALAEIEPIEAALLQSMRAENNTSAPVMNDNDEQHPQTLRESGTVRIRVLPPPRAEHVPTIPEPAPGPTEQSEPLPNTSPSPQYKRLLTASVASKSKPFLAIGIASALVAGSLVVLGLRHAPPQPVQKATLYAERLGPRLRACIVESPAATVEGTQTPANKADSVRSRPIVQHGAGWPAQRRNDRFEPVRYLKTGMYRSSRKD